MAERRSINSASERFMFARFVIGPNVTDSRSLNFPSHPNGSVKATSIRVGARSDRPFGSSPIARARPSPHDRDGLWHVAHERVPDLESSGSKKSIFPRSDFAAE